MIKPFLVLFAMSSVLVLGCGRARFEANQKKEEMVVKLENLADAPPGVERGYQIGDEVAIITNKGELYVNGIVEEIGENLVFAEDTAYAGGDRKKWLPAKALKTIRGDEKTAAKGFRVRARVGRNTIYEWFPPAQIFPAPWVNGANIKVGDTVYERRFGFEPYRGVVEQLPAGRAGNFRVKYEGYSSTGIVDREEIFRTFEAASTENLAPGDIVDFDNGYWAIVIGKRDGKIIVRSAGFPAQDLLVDVSKLRIFK